MEKYIKKIDIYIFMTKKEENRFDKTLLVRYDENIKKMLREIKFYNDDIYDSYAHIIRCAIIQKFRSEVPIECQKKLMEKNSQDRKSVV